jgi:predicted component of type VI protein secretion system
MNGLLYMLKNLFFVNKRYFILVLLVIMALALIGCSTGQAAAPPSGPVGGGCGG